MGISASFFKVPYRKTDKNLYFSSMSGSPYDEGGLENAKRSVLRFNEHTSANNIAKFQFMNPSTCLLFGDTC